MDTRLTTHPTQSSAAIRPGGRLHAWRVRWLGESDPVEAQLADIARQGARMAHVAHVCAAALLILFSAASFVALGGDTFAEIQARWSVGHQLNVAAAISLSVITLMVLAFDVGMLYAASMLRLLATRRAGLGEQWVHVLVMVSVAAIEAATYMYMAWRYESPSTALAWALIAVRAAAAPLLAVYLSMARPLPVTARDILAQAELASGAGVIRDVVREAQDTSAPLADKIALYGASAVMAAPDRARLDGMLTVVQRRQDGLQELDGSQAAAWIEEADPPDRSVGSVGAARVAGNSRAGAHDTSDGVRMIGPDRGSIHSVAGRAQEATDLPRQRRMGGDRGDTASGRSPLMTFPVNGALAQQPVAASALYDADAVVEQVHRAPATAAPRADRARDADETSPRADMARETAPTPAIDSLADVFAEPLGDSVLSGLLSDHVATPNERHGVAADATRPARRRRARSGTASQSSGA